MSLWSVWRALAIAALAVTGALIALRAWVGPFHLAGVSVNTPVNVEGVFALVFVAALVTSGMKPLCTQTEAGATLIWLAGVLVVVAAIYWRSLWFPLLSDDYILVTQATRTGAPVWKSFVMPGGDGSYRPVGYALLVWSARWAQTIAWRWHLLSLALHLANTAMVFFAARFALKRSDIAAFCALIFALHGTRPEAVVWLAGRWDVLAGFFALLGLLAFLRFYESGLWAWAVASIVLVAAAILNKESAYGFPALAAAFVSLSGPWRWRRWMVTLMAPAVLLVHRFLLFHGPGGYVDASTGRAQILSVRLLPTLKGMFPRFWAAMLFPLDWAAGVEWWAALALAGGVIALVITASVRKSADAARKSAWAAICTMGVMAPAFHLASIGGDLLGSRVYYLPVVVFALLLAVVVRGRPIAAFVAVFYAVILVHNLGVWGRVSELADHVCAAAAPRLTNAEAATISGIPVAIDGVSFFANGFAECVALHSSDPPKQWIITHTSGGPPAGTKGRVLVWDAASQTLKGDNTHGAER